MAYKNDAFNALSDYLTKNGTGILPEWFPNGRIIDHNYYCVGSLEGEEGQSLRIKLEDGRWKDHAEEGCWGSDLIDLYAAKTGLSNGDACKELLGKYNLSTPGITSSRGNQKPGGAKKKREKKKRDKKKALTFPVNTPFTQESNWDNCYLYKRGGVGYFYVVRREDNGHKGGKSICQYIYNGYMFTPGGWGQNRILYNVDSLERKPQLPVLIVEGEKACEAGIKILGDRYNCVTWSQGTGSVGLTDFSPIYSFNHVRIWPDADDNGRSAANEIARELSQYCSTIEIVKTWEFEKIKKGYDIADWDDGLGREVDIVFDLFTGNSELRQGKIFN